jgi:hypothetical protein
MSTAEITFNVGELATERRQEARKILWALAAALIIHVIVGYILAVVNQVQTLPEVPDDKPVELTIVDTEPVVKKPTNAPFIETDPSRQTAETPTEKTFESNANSVAASEAPPTGDLPMPSQEGKDRPKPDLDNQTYSLANKGALPQASVAPQPSAEPKQSITPQPTKAPSQAPTVAPTPLPEQLAMLMARPTPVPQPQTSTPVPQSSAAPQQPNSAYRREQEKARVGGNISNRGISRVNAFGTPLGRYGKTLSDAIGSRWYAYVESRREMIGIGTLQAHFTVDRTGKIKNIKILSNTSNETFANVCLQSILDANLPPIPDDVADTLPSEGLDSGDFSFTIYPN